MAKPQATPSAIPAARAPSFAAQIARFYRAFQRPLLGISSVFSFLLIWEWIGTSGAVNPIFFSSPSAILRAGVKLFGAGEMWNHMLVSGTEFAIGFGIAILFGIPFGMLLGWYKTINYIFEPFVSALNATPRVALLPLIIIWFGIGIWSKVVIVFLGALFPIILTTYAGVRTIDETLLRAARSFGANDRQIFKTIALPSSVPFIIAGMKLGLGRALVGIVVGELVAASAGVGYFIAIAGATFQTDKLFVGIFIITGFGVLMTAWLSALERRFEAWRPQRT